MIVSLLPAGLFFNDRVDEDDILSGFARDQAPKRAGQRPKSWAQRRPHPAFLGSR